MKIKVWLIIFCILIMGSSPYADAMTKSEAKKYVKDYLQYYSPSRKSTKIRKKGESASLMQCYFGMRANPETHTFTTLQREMVGLFRPKDELISVNGVNIDWDIEHPRKYWGSIEKAPIEKGDDVYFLVKREGKNVELTTQCFTDRRKVVEIFEDAAVALSKYKGKKFLDKWGYLSNDCQFSNLIHSVALISFNNRKIRKTDYNSYGFNEKMCSVKYYAQQIETGDVIDSMAMADIKNAINYLLENGSPNLARKLENELDELVSYEPITQVVAEKKGLAKNKAIESNFEESATPNEMIDSAFGIKLGSTFVESKVKISSTTGKLSLYRFTPKNPVSSLKNYAVILTPKSDQIVEIWAWNDFGYSECSEILKELEAALDRKYVALKSNYTTPKYVTYSEGERSIKAQCEGTLDVTLYLRYSDKNLDALRVSEKNDSENLQGL
jgi:hypothetical protein